MYCIYCSHYFPEVTLCNGDYICGNCWNDIFVTEQEYLQKYLGVSDD